jgi:hypothetical protein
LAESQEVEHGIAQGHRRRWPWFVLGVVVCLLLVLLVVATMSGVVPGLSSGVGAAAPKDLGVDYGDEDLGSALDKLALPAAVNALDTTLTQAEVSALANDQALRERLPLEQIQVRLLPAQRFEASALATVVGREVPVYLAGEVQVQNGWIVLKAVPEAQVGKLGLPDAVRRRVETALREAVGRAVTQAEGFTLTDLQTGDGIVHVKGRTG